MLGPLLFLVNVNDIAESLLSLVRLFADDSSLFFSATNLRDIEGIINHDLAFMASWAKNGLWISILSKQLQCCSPSDLLIFFPL